MLFSHGLLPIVTKPTRITSHTATLIDHIYTNSSISHITPGIATTDISDHLPVFCILNFKLREQTQDAIIKTFLTFIRKVSYLTSASLIGHYYSTPPKLLMQKLKMQLMQFNLLSTNMLQ